MYELKPLKGLLLAGLIGATGILAGCGGGGGGGAGTPSYWTIDVRSDAATLPINIANEVPRIGGRYTTTLYVEVKDMAGRPASGGDIGCSYAGGLDTGALYYLDGDPDHETTETIDGVDITTPNAYRSVTLSTNSGLASFHFHASSVAGAATVRCTVTDAGNVVRSDEVTIQVGGAPSGKVSQVVFDRSSPNYLFVQGYNGPTQIQLQASVVDEAGQPVVDVPAGANNLQLSIIPDPTSAADDSATLRGVNASGQTVAGTSILVRSINGQAQFTLVSGNAPGPILIEAISDRADNDVDNGVTEAVYNHVAISAVTSAPTQTATGTPLAIDTAELPAVKANIPYGALLEASGGSAPYTWSLVAPGSLPTGLSVGPSGVISGVPFGGTGGTYNFVVQVKDAQGTTVQKGISIAYTGPEPVATTPSVVTTSLPDAKVGETYIHVMTGTGGTPPYTWSATELPDGLSMTATGVLHGTPTTACTRTLPYPTCEFAVTIQSDSLYSTKRIILEIDS
jgi:hypothetical protein